MPKRHWESDVGVDLDLFKPETEGNMIPITVNRRSGNSFICIFIGCLVAGLQAGFPLQATPPSGYTLVWSDEFNDSSLDTTHWTYDHLGGYRSGYNTTNSVSVANGYLTITTYTENGVHYTGYVDTRFKYTPKYGYIEASIRTVNTPGNWSAFWMWVETMGATLDPHNDGVEADIMEHRSVNSSGTDISALVDSALHWDGYSTNAKSASNGLRGAGLNSGFHTYAVEWTPTYQKFYIDGTYLYTLNNDTQTDPPTVTGTASTVTGPVSQRSLFLLLTTEIQSGWGGTIPAAGYGSLLTSVTKMDVDYVRVYQNPPATPTAPVDVRVSPSSGNWKLSWDLTENAPYYNVKRATTSGGPYTTIATTGIAATGANYVDTTAVAGTTYYYVVSALNGTVEGPNSLEVCTVPTGSGVAHAGTGALRAVYTAAGLYKRVSQTVNVTSTTTYEAGIWAKGSGRCRLLVYGGTTLLGSTFIDPSPSWEYYSISVNSGTNSQLIFRLDDNSVNVGVVSYDDAFLGVSGGNNLLANPDFESGNTGWVMTNAGTVWSIVNTTVDPGNERSGWQSAKLVMSGTTRYARIESVAPVSSNTTYEYGVWARGGGRSSLRIYGYPGGSQLNSTVLLSPTSSGWTYFSTSFNTGSYTQVKVRLDDQSSTAATMYLDDCFLGISGGENVLANPDFEDGVLGWDSTYGYGQWSIGQW